METVALNVNRLEHLLSLYGMTRSELLSRLNTGRKKLITEKEIFTTRVQISHLVKVDKIFERGLSYYLDPKNPTKSVEESIFFRKENFNAELNFGARKRVNQFEKEKISLTILAKLAQFKFTRKLSVYSLSDSAESVAKELRSFLCPPSDYDDKRFLQNFIGQLSTYNILVFEFVDQHNKKDKANIDGFFLTPNFIVLKRNQKAFKREISTLAHELGHYLLNKEDIDGSISSESEKVKSLNEIEKWCDDFAFFFLAGDYSKSIEGLPVANPANDYHHDLVELIARNTQLSTLAVYTRFLVNNIISPLNYKTIKKSILEQIKDRETREAEEFAKKKAKDLQEGRKPRGSTPKPINSPLYVKTLQGALYTGLISEAEFCQKLKIKPDKLEKYLA